MPSQDRVRAKNREQKVAKINVKIEIKAIIKVEFKAKT